MSTPSTLPLAPLLIVDDDPAMRERLHALVRELEPEARHAFKAGSLMEAERLLAGARIAFALVDIGLPDGSGVELIQLMQHAHPEITSVVVSAWGQEDTVLACLRAGASGYLLKEREDIELSLALRSLQRGGAPIDPSIARRILLALGEDAESAREAGAEPSPLSDRERQILSLVARGYSNREIAELLGLSRFTIEDYTKSIYRKLSVRSRTAAVFEAKAKGLLG